MVPLTSFFKNNCDQTECCLYSNDLQGSKTTKLPRFFVHFAKTCETIGPKDNWRVTEELQQQRQIFKVLKL